MVLPHILNTDILGRVKMILCGGDLQAISQIDNDMMSFMPNLYRGSCGWHIVDRSWIKRVVGINSFPKKHSVFFIKICVT